MKKATLSALVVILSNSIGSFSVNLTSEGKVISAYPPSLVISGGNIISIECAYKNLTEGYSCKYPSLLPVSSTKPYIFPALVIKSILFGDI